MAEQWYSIIEYARTFAVSDMTVRRRIKTGRLHAVLREGKYYIPVNEHQKSQLQKVYHSSHQIENIMDRDEVNVVAPSNEKKEQPSPFHQQHRPTPSSFRPQSHNSSSQLNTPIKTYYSLPESISSPIQHAEYTTVQSNVLLTFCDSVIKKFNDLELRIEENYRAKLQNFEAKLKEKDSEIGLLQQQLEDLQLLVKILERKL